MLYSDEKLSFSHEWFENYLENVKFATSTKLFSAEKLRVAMKSCRMISWQLNNWVIKCLMIFRVVIKPFIWGKTIPIIHPWWTENVLNVLVTFLHDFLDPLWIGFSESKLTSSPKKNKQNFRNYHKRNRNYNFVCHYITGWFDAVVVHIFCMGYSLCYGLSEIEEVRRKIQGV